MSLDRASGHSLSGHRRLLIGGERLEYCTEGAGLEALAHPAFADPGGTRSPPDVRLSARWAEPRVPVDAVLCFDAGTWRLHRWKSQWVFGFYSPVLGDGPYKCLFVDPDFCEGEVVVRRASFSDQDTTNPFDYPLDELLMIHRLLRHGRGIELHACAVRDASGAGYLFVGESGAGKTTMARLWEASSGARVLSDDRVIVRLEDGVLRLHGTPWHGEGCFAQGASAPLARLFFLRHGQVDGAASVELGAATMRLFSATFAVFHDAALAEQALRMCETIARAAPCSQLDFVPTAAAVDYVRRLAGGAGETQLR